MKLFAASLYKELINKVRYLGNTIFSMILFCVIFVVLLSGYSAVSGGSAFSFGSNTGAIIVAYYAWTMMLSVYTSTGYVVTENKKNGTLENLVCSTPRYTSLLIWESIVDSVVYFVFSWLIIGALALICRVRIHFLVLDVFVLLIGGLLAVLGLSLVVAGSAMVLRKMDGVMSIMQFLLLGSLFLPDIKAVRMFAPFFAANKMLTEVFLDGKRLTAFSLTEYALLLFNIAFFMLLGIAVFSLCIRYAKKNGTLSYY